LEVLRKLYKRLLDLQGNREKEAAQKDYFYKDNKSPKLLQKTKEKLQKRGKGKK